MNRVILALGTVVVLACVKQPSSRTVSEPPRATVFDELAAAVKEAVAAKRVEDNRLAQYGVEKQRLVSRLMPNGDWAHGHPLAIEGYVSDPESAKKRSVVLDPEFMAVEAVQSETHRSRELQLVLEERFPLIKPGCKNGTASRKAKNRAQISNSERRREQKNGVESPKTGPRIPNRTSQTAANTPDKQQRVHQSGVWRWRKVRKRDETVAFPSVRV